MVFLAEQPRQPPGAAGARHRLRPAPGKRNRRAVRIGSRSALLYTLHKLERVFLYKKRICPPGNDSQKRSEAIYKAIFPKSGHQSGGSAKHDGNNVVKDTNNHGNQRTDTGSLRRLRLCVLLYQEQDQTDERNAAAKQTPTETAIIYYWRRLLHSAATGAYCSAIADLLTALVTKCHNHPP